MATHVITHLTGYLSCPDDDDLDGYRYDSVSLDGEELIAEDPYHFYCGRCGDFGYGDWNSPGDLIANMVIKLSENGDAVKVVRKKGAWHFNNWQDMPFVEEKKSE